MDDNKNSNYQWVKSTENKWTKVPLENILPKTIKSTDINKISGVFSELGFSEPINLVLFSNGDITSDSAVLNRDTETLQGVIAKGTKVYRPFYIGSDKICYFNLDSRVIDPDFMKLVDSGEIPEGPIDYSFSVGSQETSKVTNEPCLDELCENIMNVQSVEYIY